MKVVEYCKSDIGKRYDSHIEIRSQKRFISDIRGETIIDFVGKVENIQEDFDIICDRIGIPRVELEKRNVSDSSKKHYSEFYTTEARETVEEFFGEDIDTLGYTFEECYDIGE
jgi:hypothetical protein